MILIPLLAMGWTMLNLGMVIYSLVKYNEFPVMTFFNLIIWLLLITPYCVTTWGPH